jgi:hypothetical protein
MRLERLAERLLDEAPDHLVPDLGADGTLQDRPWSLARAEPGQPDTPSGDVEGPVERGRDRPRRHLDPEALADRREVLERDRGRVALAGGVVG